jgi:hypothetical protein
VRVFVSARRVALAFVAIKDAGGYEAGRWQRS